VHARRVAPSPGFPTPHLPPFPSAAARRLPAARPAIFRLTGVGSPSYGGRHARGGTATRGEPRERSVRRTHPVPGPAVVGGAVVLLLLSAALARPVAADLRPGMVLGRDNWEEAKDLLPDEFLQAYRRGEFRHEIRSWEPPRLGDDPIFGAALKENEGRYDLVAECSIIERSCCKPAGPIMAWPFPKINPADPRAAAKIVWNYFYTLYYGGNGHYRADLLWVSRHGLDRSISVDAFFKHYDGQHPKFRETNNRKDLLSQTFAEVLSPADVQGILSLTWRYRDPHARDSVWTYVPSLRRTRQVSPSNRSDGFLGSDLSQDDGPYFDGKVQDFEWKLVGEQDLLVLFDRPSFEQQALLSRLPQGGWRMVIPGGARVGFQMADWKGAPWCPVQEVLVRRPHWIVEAVPKDRYYLYGKILFRFDKDIYLGSYASKYDWKGVLLNSYVAVRTNIIPVGPGEFWGWAGGAVAVGINWKLDRASTAGIVAGTDVPADSRIPLSGDVFSLQRLHSDGK